MARKAKGKPGKPAYPAWDEFNAAIQAFNAADSEDDVEFARVREELRAATVRWARATNAKRGGA